MTPKNKRSVGRPKSDNQNQPTEKKILDAATMLFLTHGYQEVSVDDIAHKCNVTKATVYYYYKTKAELFTETMIYMMERIRQLMNQILTEDLPLKSKLLNVAKAHFKATVDIDIEGYMRETKNALSKDQTYSIQKAEDHMYEALEQAFQQAMDSGEITEVNPIFAAHSYVSLLKVGNYRTAKGEGIFSNVDEAAEQIVHFFWTGLFH